jgi:osmotically-inducible protein OsmY
MKNDLEIQQDVINQLSWEPFLKASDIGVTVKNGIVTLTGQVDSYYKKISAEKAARKVAGVRAIAEDIQLNVSPSFIKTDAELAESVLNALKWHSAVDEEKLKIKVEDGVVTLDGEVEWEFQRTSARNAVSNLLGIKNVISNISLKPKLTASDIRAKISSAFHRTATIDARKIEVEIQGNKAILRGNVRSYAEKDDAESAAWSAPGIAYVENKLVLEPEFELSF